MKKPATISLVLARWLLGVLVLASVPLFSINTRQQEGIALSPLEVTAVVATIHADWLPEIVFDSLSSLLFVGTYMRQAYKECSSKDCSWAQPVPIDQVWAQASVRLKGPESEEWRVKREGWKAATGSSQALMSSACVAVTLGGLSCFLYPVRMVSVGLLIISFGSLLCPDFSILPPMLFALLLSSLLFMGDARARLLTRRREIEQELQIGNKTMAAAAGIFGMKIGDGGGSERKPKSVKGRMRKFL